MGLWRHFICRASGWDEALQDQTPGSWALVATAVGEVAPEQGIEHRASDLGFYMVYVELCRQNTVGIVQGPSSLFSFFDNAFGLWFQMVAGCR